MFHTKPQNFARRREYYTPDPEWIDRPPGEIEEMFATVENAVSPYLRRAEGPDFLPGEDDRHALTVLAAIQASRVPVVREFLRAEHVKELKATIRRRSPRPVDESELENLRVEENRDLGIMLKESDRLSGYFDSLATVVMRVQGASLITGDVPVFISERVNSRTRFFKRRQWATSRRRYPKLYGRSASMPLNRNTFVMFIPGPRGFIRAISVDGDGATLSAVIASRSIEIVGASAEALENALRRSEGQAWAPPDIWMKGLR